MNRGMRIPIVVGAASLAHVGVVVATSGIDEGLQRALRFTPRYSVVFLVLTMVVTPMARLRPSVTAVLWLAQRRYLGLAVAAAHSVHLGVIVASFALREEFRDRVDPLGTVLGFITYLLLYALAFTSSGAAVRTLGARRWKLLHRVGVWTLWFAFALSYMPRAIVHPGYMLLALGLGAVPILRLLAHRLKKRRESASP